MHTPENSVVSSADKRYSLPPTPPSGREDEAEEEVEVEVEVEEEEEEEDLQELTRRSSRDDQENVANR